MNHGGLMVAFKRSTVSKKEYKGGKSASEGNWKMTMRRECSGCIGESEMQRRMRDGNVYGRGNHGEKS